MTLPNGRPRVSIVTPSFNQGRFLRRTVDSVLGQSYPDIEYVVMDGGSTDESAEILRSYGDRFPWVSEADRGQTHAINKGMARLSGDILGYLNSDDVLLPGTVERVVRFFEENPDCDMVYGAADYIDTQDRFIRLYKTGEFSFERLMQGCMVCQPAAFWRRRIADRVGAFDERLHYAMDYDYWQRMSLAGGDIRYLPEKLACAREYPETKSIAGLADASREIFELCRRHTGHTHLFFFIGYWYHLMHGRGGPMSRILRKLPLDHMVLGWIHHRWFHGKLSFFREGSAHLFNEFLLRVKAAFQGKDSFYRSFRGTDPAASQDEEVPGYYSDGWFGPEVVVRLKSGIPGGRRHLTGIAAVNAIMTVRAGDIELARASLMAGRLQKISVSPGSAATQALHIAFSNSFTTDDGRDLSFQLLDTDMFSRTVT